MPRGTSVFVASRSSPQHVERAAGTRIPRKDGPTWDSSIKLPTQAFEQEIQRLDPDAGRFLGGMVRPVPHGGARARADRRRAELASCSIVKLNVDENQHTPNHFGVQGIPTMILFKDGQMVERIVGFMPKPQLMKKLEPHLAAAAAPARRRCAPAARFACRSAARVWLTAARGLAYSDDVGSHREGRAEFKTAHERIRREEPIRDSRLTAQQAEVCGRDPESQSRSRGFLCLADRQRSCARARAAPEQEQSGAEAMSVVPWKWGKRMWDLFEAACLKKT